MLVSTRHYLNRRRMLRLLDELETADEAAISVHLPQNLSVSEIEQTFSVVPAAGQILPVVAGEITRSTTGAVLFWGEQHKYLVLPPFPVAESLISQSYEVGLLRSLLQQDLIIALVLVRLGAYAVGVFQGEKLLSSKVGTGLIHSRHKKGGTSQHRFQRHREKQMEIFFDRVCVHARERFEPYLQQLDYVCYGGEHTTIGAFRKRCQFLQKLEACTLKALLNIPEPRQATLEIAISKAWSSQVVQWYET